MASRPAVVNGLHDLLGPAHCVRDCANRRGNSFPAIKLWFLLVDELDARLENRDKAVEAGAVEVGKPAGHSEFSSAVEVPVQVESSFFPCKHKTSHLRKRKDALFFHRAASSCRAVELPSCPPAWLTIPIEFWFFAHQVVGR